MDDAIGARAHRGFPLTSPAFRGRGVLAFLIALALAGSLAAPVRAEVLVVATTPDLKSIADAVSGGSVGVESLVPPGGDAEAFEPRPSHLALLGGAALVLRIGLGYDEWLDRLLVRTENPKIARGGAFHLDLSGGVALLEVQGRSVEGRSGHAHGAANPHYWLDPANVEIMAAAIAEALVRAAPEARERIVDAHAAFAAELEARLRRWATALEPHRGAAIVTYHNSWPYFARRFRLDIVDQIEPREGVAPNARRLAALAARMREARARVIVHEPFEPADASRFLAERTGARVVALAPSVGGKPEAEDILALFDHNVGLLAKALSETP